MTENQNQSALTPEELEAQHQAARHEALTMLDPARVKKKAVAFLDAIKKKVNNAELLSDAEWTAAMDAADLYRDVVEFRKAEKEATAE